MLTVDYMDHLLEELKDPEHAAGYLTAALEDSEEVFLIALRDVAQAYGGIGALSEATKLNRENLYDMLSANGNPRLSSITAMLNQLGFTVQFVPRSAR